MHAIRQYELGGPDVLRFEELPDLEPVAGQVRVRVSASGVHVLDTYLREGFRSPVHPGLKLPMTPGREVAGQVDAIGAGVDETWIGQRVVAHLGQASGGYAEHAVVPVESLHVLPDDLSYAVAVAAIGTGRTAVGILDQSPVAADDIVLVTAAAGGLGALLVQAAGHAGAKVVGLAGGDARVTVARRQGADLAVDYRTDGWDEIVRQELGGNAATLVFDAVGGAVGRAAYDLLAPGGRIAQYGWFSDDPPVYSDPDRPATIVLGPAMMARPGGLRSLETESLELAAAGIRVPLVGSTFALADAAEAHRALRERRTHGKVVLIPGTTA